MTVRMLKFGKSAFLCASALILMTSTLFVSPPARANCVRAITNELNTSYGYKITADNGSGRVVLGEGVLAPGESAALNYDTSNNSMQIDLLENGELMVRSFIDAENLAACKFGSAGSPPYCSNIPNEGDLTLMAPLLNCGKTMN